MSEKTKLGNHTTRRNFLPGDPLMVRDYRDRERPSIKGVIQDLLGACYVSSYSGSAVIVSWFKGRRYRTYG